VLDTCLLELQDLGSLHHSILNEIDFSRAERPTVRRTRWLCSVCLHDTNCISLGSVLWPIKTGVWGHWTVVQLSCSVLVHKSYGWYMKFHSVSWLKMSIEIRRLRLFPADICVYFSELKYVNIEYWFELWNYKCMWGAKIEFFVELWKYTYQKRFFVLSNALLSLTQVPCPPTIHVCKGFLYWLIRAV
jgi:hypothetical protein